MIPFAEYCGAVERHIESVYRIRVVTRDVPDPMIGDLDGAEIHIDYALTAEQRLFLLAHLFGHTVQWNVDPRAVEIGRPLQPPVPEQLLPAVLDYERDAAGYALTMLREVGVTGLDQWLADFTACDMAYLAHFYRTGEKKDFAGFWRDGASLIQARAIPAFTPARRVFRGDGIVI